MEAHSAYMGVVCNCNSPRTIGVMDDNIEIPINLPLDENGMFGRECLECKKYFKVTPGTGLDTDYCHCPYCEYEGKYDTFWTQAQLEYAQSIAFNEIVAPALDKLSKSFKDLERKTRNSFIQIKVSTPKSNVFPIKYYTEEELETSLICDNCGLNFSVFGVFARCPDCNEFNAFLMYEKSLEVTNKQLKIISKPEVPREIVGQYLSTVISSGVSAFDGLGKELRKRRPDLFPDKPKNLFQNILLLDEHLDKLISKSHSDFEMLNRMFQVRHLYEHNMGVVDEDFVKKVPSYSNLLGRKFILNVDDVDLFIIKMNELGQIIKGHFKNA